MIFENGEQIQRTPFPYIENQCVALPHHLNNVNYIISQAGTVMVYMASDPTMEAKCCGQPVDLALVSGEGNSASIIIENPDAEPCPYMLEKKEVTQWDPQTGLSIVIQDCAVSYKWEAYFKDVCYSLDAGTSIKNQCPAGASVRTTKLYSNENCDESDVNEVHEGTSSDSSCVKCDPIPIPSPECPSPTLQPTEPTRIKTLCKHVEVVFNGDIIKVPYSDVGKSIPVEIIDPAKTDGSKTTMYLRMGGCGEESQWINMYDDQDCSVNVDPQDLNRALTSIGWGTALVKNCDEPACDYLLVKEPENDESKAMLIDECFQVLGTSDSQKVKVSSCVNGQLTIEKFVGSKNLVHGASAAARSSFQIAILRMKIAMLRLYLDVHQLD